MNNDGKKRRILLVTGLSGAGKTSVLKILEDVGFETVDKLPLFLLGNLIAPRELSLFDENVNQSLAIGIDIRTRGFGISLLVSEVDRIRKDDEIDIQVLFLDCTDQDLLRRYTETRHRHPLAQDRPVIDGIRYERNLLAPLHSVADMILDTSELKLGQLKEQLFHQFGSNEDIGLLVSVVSFSFKKGLPREADLVFDVRFLANPYYDAALRSLTGLDEAVAKYIANDVDFSMFFANLVNLTEPLLPRYVAEGKSYLTIAFGCTGGRHRSVFVATRLTAWLKEHGYQTQMYHRDLQYNYDRL